MNAHETIAQRTSRCEDAVATHPESAAAHYNLGLAYQKTGRFRLAEEAYQKAVELDPDLAEAWVNLGGVRLHQWDFEGCLEASREAVRRRQDLAVAHYNLGQAYLYMNDPENLVLCNKKVLELERDNGAAHYYTAVGLLALGDVAAAERHAGRALELGHQPTPDFLKALERASRGVASREPVVLEMSGPESPETPKED